jgi:HTH-like domain
VNRFQFVADYQRRYGVKRLCTIVGVARSSYYYWRATAGDRAARQAADARLAARIRAVHCESDGTYGVPRITAELREEGERISHKRIAPVMRSINLAGVRLRRRHRTTIPDLFNQLNGLIRQLVRQAEGRDAEPTACVIDAQRAVFLPGGEVAVDGFPGCGVVGQVATGDPGPVDVQDGLKTSANVPATSQGIDTGKKITDRKRHIGVDIFGLLLASGSPPRACRTTPAGSTCSPASPTPTPASPKPGPTPATAPKSSTTAPPSALMSKSSNATPTPRASKSSHDGGA